MLPPVAINRLFCLVTPLKLPGSLPTRWKTATVVMLRLRGLLRTPANIVPFSLLPAVGKTVGAFLLYELIEFVEKNTKRFQNSNLDSEEVTRQHTNFCALVRIQLGTSILRNSWASNISMWLKPLTA
ncbi:hypothetical protein Zmor_011771 [Zophobas morio]|uniref:Uncharacterized protein n=1 Tax=Zophobas morio TaxID=2755281 RepID=A0AA38HI41_9CUCU|nr:hypothetical protein Zmor_011771 [Zophobas morio]